MLEIPVHDLLYVAAHKFSKQDSSFKSWPTVLKINKIKISNVEKK